MFDKYIEVESENKIYVYRLAGFWERFLAKLIDFPFMMISFGFVTIFGPWLYYALLESSYRQATIGKMALGLKVVDAEGSRIDFGKASGRFWSKCLNFFTFGIGYLLMLFNDHSQNLHDLIADTIVVHHEPVEVYDKNLKLTPFSGSFEKRIVYRERDFV